MLQVCAVARACVHQYLSFWDMLRSAVAIYNTTEQGSLQQAGVVALALQDIFWGVEDNCGKWPGGGRC